MSAISAPKVYGKLNIAVNNDGSDDDPYGETMPEKCLEYLVSASE